MRGMRPAKNPKARSNLVPRQIRSRRDAEEYEFDDEDYEALEDCDGTEEGAVAELCKQPRVSIRPAISKILPVTLSETN